MPAFCGNCGAPVADPSGFCGSCGARAGQAPAAPAAAAAVAAPSSGGSVLKVVLIVVGVLFVLGILSIGGIYYAAHRFVAMAEKATGTTTGEVARTIREAASREKRPEHDAHPDGCRLLSKEEASALLGIEVERVDGKPNSSRSGEYCSFFVKPGAIAEHEKSHPPASSPSAGQPMQELLDGVKLRARTMVEATSHGDEPYFTYTVEREDGKITCASLGVANGLSGVGPDVSAGLGGKAADPLQVGDQAVMGIGESMMCVVKGNSAVTLELNQIAGARGIGIAIAQKILPRL